MSAWVLVPCPRHRLHELLTLLADLQHPRERVVVVTTLPDPVAEADIADAAAHLVLFPREGKLFSAWVNTGLDRVDELRGGEPTEVLCVGSDARGHAKSVQLLADALRAHDLVMAGPDWHNQCAGQPVATYGQGDPRTLWNRVPGACFMLAAERGLRMDERFRWWYSDDSLEMDARKIGRVGLVAGTGLEHDTDHPLDETQTRHAAEDLLLFKEKWGVEPW